jgi:hypothetical protein
MADRVETTRPLQNFFPQVRELAAKVWNPTVYPLRWADLRAIPDAASVQLSSNAHFSSSHILEQWKVPKGIDRS